MKTKKGLIEERNALKADFLTKNESASKKELEEFRSKVQQLNAEIASFEAERKNAKQENRGVQEMDNKDLEARGLAAANDIYRGKNDTKAITEFRDAAAAVNSLAWSNTAEGTEGNGGITIPTNVANSIIAKLGEDSPVFNLVRKLPATVGSLKVVREDDSSDDGFVGELDDPQAIKPTLKSVTLTQKRVGAYMQLSQQMINDAGFPIMDYVNGRLSRSLAKAIERAILVGGKEAEGTNAFTQPIIGNVATENAISLAGAEPTVEELIDIHNTLNPGYLSGSAWIVSREAFNGMSKLKDGNGEYLVFKNNIVGSVPGYTLFGAPVYVSDQLNGKETQIIFGNFTAGYSLMIKKGMNLVHVTNDSAQALQGGHMVVMDGYMDGAVVNPSAFVTATGKATTASAKARTYAK